MTQRSKGMSIIYHTGFTRQDFFGQYILK